MRISLLAYRQVTERGTLHTFDEVPSIEGKVTVMMPPYRFAHGGQEMKSPPLQCGQHTAEVLREIGYDDAGMDKLRAAKVI